MIRLDKYLCEMEAGTRSEVKAFIKKGRVTVNGETAKSPEQKVDETKDTVTLDGHSFSYQKYFYYMLHKPAGVVTAVRDHHDQTVLDLLVDAPGKDLSPVGRLDKDTEGLLLITNDGALAHRLLSPVKHVPKTYLVHTKKPVTSQMCEKLEAGVEIGDETPTAPCKDKTAFGYRLWTASDDHRRTVPSGQADAAGSWQRSRVFKTSVDGCPRPG